VAQEGYRSAGCVRPRCPRQGLSVSWQPASQPADPTLDRHGNASLVLMG
jgi:hypothetical protein